jgi:hypothetical protein
MAETDRSRRTIVHTDVLYNELIRRMWALSAAKRRDATATSRRRSMRFAPGRVPDISKKATARTEETTAAEQEAKAALLPGVGS